jgi:DNA-binding NarL/FixJ family response regulator
MQSLVSLIQGSELFCIDRHFGSAEEALPEISKLTGIIIIDMKLPGMNGAALVEEIMRVNPSMQCMICSMYDDDEFIFTALRNGALSYLLKDSTPDEILVALKELKNGGSPMSPYIANKVIASFRRQKNSYDLLSDREKEVLHLLSEGLLYKEIGKKCEISYETVKKHIKHIYKKLQVQNKVEAVNKFTNKS